LNDPINTRARIQAQARQAALKYADVNQACPYPFHTVAADVFKAAFSIARARIAQEAIVNFCGCDLELTVQELECGRCSSCGKAVLA